MRAQSLDHSIGPVQRGRMLGGGFTLAWIAPRSIGVPIFRGAARTHAHPPVSTLSRTAFPLLAGRAGMSPALRPASSLSIDRQP